LVLSSCAKVDSSGGASNSSNKVYTLTWLPPATFENNDQLLPLNDLQEYRIYYGDSVGNVTQNVTTISPDQTSFSTQSFDANVVGLIATVSVAMTSVSKDGVESVLSDIVTFNP